MKAYSLDFRQKIIETYENEPISQRQLAKRFGVALSFITKLLKQHRETGDLIPKPRSGRPRLLNDEHLQVITQLIEDQNDLTLAELCHALDERFHGRVSEATLWRAMQQLNFTRKKKALHPSHKETPRVQTLRVEYWDKIRDVPLQDLVFIDESGVNLGLTRVFGWALQGARAHGEQPKRGQNVSIVAGLSLKGVVASTCLLGSCDGMIFEAFVANRLVPNLWPGACVVMDNCSVHQESIIRPLIEAAGARLIYLPPYSPDFSPIENFWSKVKSILRTLGARTYEKLSEAISIAFGKVSETDVRNWFAHCCYCSL